MTMTDEEIQEAMQLAADLLAAKMADLLEALPPPRPEDMEAFRVIDRLDWRIWSYRLIGPPPLPLYIITGV